jgi:ribosomal protein S18 acetylase RimI-like enzyme
VRLDATSRDDFFRVHSAANGADWCFCVAWWTPTWTGWGERTAQQNRAQREALFAQDEYDGYLLYADGLPIGWCQVGRRDRLAKLVGQYRLLPDSATWAITCFQIAPAYRRQGLASALLQDVLRDLRARGVRRVEAFPKRGKGLGPEDVWTGPEQLFVAAGFRLVRDDPSRPVLAWEAMDGE